MKIKYAIGLLAGCLLFGIQGAFGSTKESGSKSESSCSYTLSPKDVELKWTAYKTTQKVGVSGTLTKISLNEKKPAVSIKKLLHGLEFHVDSLKVSTGNPGRDLTLSQNFFKFLNGDGQLRGVIEKVSTRAKKGFVKVKLKLGKKMKKIRLKLSVKDDTVYASGTIDMLELGMNQAFEALRKACGVLHTGADGKSKTWTDVKLDLVAKPKKTCS